MITFTPNKILIAAAISILIFTQPFGSFPLPIQVVFAIIIALLILALDSLLLSNSARKAPLTDTWSIDPNTLTDAIFVTDINGHIMGLNDKFRALVPTSVEAENVDQLLAPLHALTVQRSQAEDVVNAVKSSPDIKFTDRLNLSDGREIERTTRPIKKTGNRIWILNDVTHVVMANDDRAMHHSMVEEDAARTAEMAEQLYLAKAELEQKQTELTRLAYTDPMTGLFNRRRFLSKAEEVIHNTEDSSSIWIVMLDIDHFKGINDTHGHAAGDVAIVDFANLISTAVGARGFVGRMGGEEFAAILTPCSRDEAFRIAELVRRNTASNLTLNESTEIQFTTSVGVAAWLPAETSIEPALDRADRALYNAKAYGRNRVVGFE